MGEGRKEITSSKSFYGYTVLKGSRETVLEMAKRDNEKSTS